MYISKYIFVSLCIIIRNLKYFENKYLKIYIYIYKLHSKFYYIWMEYLFNI